MNTIIGWQIFSALPYSEYDPNLMTYPQQSTLDVNKYYGHFDPFNFDHLSFYAKDYVTGEYYDNELLFLVIHFMVIFFS